MKSKPVATPAPDYAATVEMKPISRESGSVAMDLLQRINSALRDPTTRSRLPMDLENELEEFLAPKTKVGI